ncbi:DAK2 domain-containing protein [Corynebacterium mayonis]
MRSTRALAAKKARASYLGDSTRDVPDPGAIVVTGLLGGEDKVDDFR